MEFRPRAWRPKLQFTGRMSNYSLETLRKDVIAGMIVGIIAIPLALAFAIASGVQPEYGITTAVIAGICVAVFGGSHVQIAGPTGAFVPILFAIVAKYGYFNLLLAGFLAGVILVIMGLTKMGSLIKFIPRPVTVGFTAGIAVIIFFGQIDTFLGIQGMVKHEFFLDNLGEIMLHLHTVNLYSIVVSIISLFFVLFSHRIVPGIPGPLVGLILSTLVAALFFDGSVETIGSKFGGISASIPTFDFSQIKLESVIYMLGPAMTIAVLGGIESLLSCVVADGMTGRRHDSNRELIGQGIANMITPLFGGIPATGAIARTATNVRNGGSTPISAIIHSVTVLVLVLIFAPMVSLIPLASLAPILMVVAWNMSERKEFYHLFKTTRSDAAVLMVTFLLTVFVNLTMAVELGLLMAAVLFINRMSILTSIEKVLPDRQSRDKVTPEIVNPMHDCPQISIFTIDGVLFFGAVEVFEKTLLECIHSNPRILILRMGNVAMMDASAEVALESIVHHFKKQGGIVVISGIKKQPEEVLKKSGLYEIIGDDHFYKSTGMALTYALSQIEIEKCNGCLHNAFYECPPFSRSKDSSLST